ncbi:MAG: PEGA domain-containing protein [Planctomycetota bacterium]|nr:MAG: PEGA domain-containing protein [Planctomycetota bacterium]
MQRRCTRRHDRPISFAGARAAGLRWLLFVAALVVASGCIERRLWVRTEPAGAHVLLDGVSVGRSPVQVPFSFYGTRRLDVRAPGYRAVTRTLRLRAPWYAWPGLDLVTEVLWPWTILDRKEVHITLEPSRPAPLEPLVERAETTRAAGRLLALPPPQPTPAPPGADAP